MEIESERGARFHLGSSVCKGRLRSTGMRGIAIDMNDEHLASIKWRIGRSGYTVIRGFAIDIME